MYRIWKIERNVNNSRTAKITTTSILRVVIDAALLYFMTLLCTLVNLACSNNGSLVMTDVLTPIISITITFYMVIIRIAMGKQNRSRVLTTHEGSTSDTNRGDSGYHPLKPLQVHISRFTHTDSASERRNSNLDQPPTVKEV